jgi:hypothetical protein
VPLQRLVEAGEVTLGGPGEQSRPLGIVEQRQHVHARPAAQHLERDLQAECAGTAETCPDDIHVHLYTGLC